MSFYGVGYGPRVIAGAGSVRSLAYNVTILTGPKAAVLLVADSGLVPLGIVDRAADILRRGGHEVSIYADIAGEPKEEQIEAARRLGRATGSRAAVCLGGGSALDAGKLAATLMLSDEPVGAFRLAARDLPAKCIPIVCVPTTAGTGSEMTGISVVSDERKVKNWFWGAELLPDLAILDPELTLDLPPRITAITGMDALVHAIEAATNRNASPESDVAAYRAIDLVCRNLPTAVHEPGNLAARSAMLDAAALGGLAISKAGTALAHNIGHALGSLAPVPHGVAVTLAMAATAEWVLEGNRPAFTRVAEAMGLGPEPDRVPDAFRRLATEIGLHLDTARIALGVTAERLAEHMAAPENAAMRKSTRRPVMDADLLPLAEATVVLKA